MKNVFRLVSILAALLFSLAPTHAATFTVSNTNDSGAGSLRQAITDADALAGRDEIVFAQGANQTFATRQTITTTGSQLQVNSDLSITGSRAGVTIANNQPGEDALQILGGTVVLADLTFDGDDDGVRSDGVLTVRRCTFRDSEFGLFPISGSARVQNCTFTRITSDAVFGNLPVSIDSSTLSGNRNAVSRNGAVTVTNSIIAGNTDSTSGITDGGNNIIGGDALAAGLENSGPNSPILKDNGGPTFTIDLLSGSPAIDRGNSSMPFDQRGRLRPFDNPNSSNGGGNLGDIGAVEQGSTTELQAGPSFVVTKLADTADSACTFADCSLREAIIAANGAAGDDVITVPAGVYTLTRTGTGEDAALTGDFDIASNGKVTINGAGARSTIVEAGTVGGANGNGIDRVFEVLSGGNLVVDGLTVRNGKAANGGGIRTNGGGTVTLRNSTLRDNSASFGGGISNSGDLTIQRSTLSSNSASSNGGGISNGGPILIQDSTLGDNSASGAGGGIQSNGTVTIQRSTLSGNSAPTGGGGIRNISGGTLNLGNSLVAGNSGGIGPDIRGDVNSEGYNLIGNASGAIITGNTTGNQTGVDPLLGELGDNGGPTETFLPQSGSPAIDKANATDADQRGVTRPRDDLRINNASGGNGSDIGALEVVVIDPAGASGLVVTTNADAVASDGLISLREAIGNANENGDQSDITFASNVTGAITLASPLEISLSLSVAGPGAKVLALSGGGATRHFFIQTGASATISGLTLRDGRANDSGMGAASPSTRSGGSILNEGTLVLLDCALSGNRAVGAVPSNSFEEGDTFGRGGAIQNTGVATLRRCTLSNNIAQGGPSGGGASSGAILSGSQPNHSLTMDSCTLSGNMALATARTNSTSGFSPGSLGGAISVSGGTALLQNVTIAGNSAQTAEQEGFSNGGGLSVGNATLTLQNSLIAGNSARKAGNAPGAGPDLSGQASGNFNLLGNASGATLGGSNNQIGVDAKLGPLADNGGPTDTFALLTGSPAINAGNSAEDVDQRGAARPQGASDDIGALEMQLLSIGNVTEAEGFDGKNITFTVTLSSTSTRDVTVGYSTADGTATAGTDYVSATNQTLTIPAGQTKGDISIGIIGDTIVEADETFTVALSNVSNAAITGATGTGTIQNDDSEPRSLVVTTTSDSSTNIDGETSLREALIFANEKSGEDTITFDATVFETRQTITLGSGSPLPAVTGELILTGPDAGVEVTGRVGPNNALFSVGSGARASSTKLFFRGSKTGVRNNGTFTLSDGGFTGSTTNMENNGTATLVRCLVGQSSVGVQNNKTLTADGATFTGNTNALVNASGATAMVRTSTFSGNAAAVTNSGTMTLSNSTLGQNGDAVRNQGGSAIVLQSTLVGNSNGVLNSGGANLRLLRATVAGNGDGLRLSGSGTAELRSTLLVGNGTNLIGTPSSGGSNLTDVTAQVAGLETDGNGFPLLKPNGGPTATVALLSGSRAIDRGEVGIKSGNDQRGAEFPRVMNGRADIGAFEFQTPIAPQNLRETAPSGGSS